MIPFIALKGHSCVYPIQLRDTPPDLGPLLGRMIDVDPNFETPISKTHQKPWMSVLFILGSHNLGSSISSTCDLRMGCIIDPKFWEMILYIGRPKKMMILEIPIKLDENWGYPYFRKPPYFESLHLPTFFSAIDLSKSPEGLAAICMNQILRAVFYLHRWRLGVRRYWIDPKLIPCLW